MLDSWDVVELIRTKNNNNANNKKAWIRKITFYTVLYKVDMIKRYSATLKYNFLFLHLALMTWPRRWKGNQKIFLMMRFNLITSPRLCCRRFLDIFKKNIERPLLNDQFKGICLHKSTIFILFSKPLIPLKNIYCQLEHLFAETENSKNNAVLSELKQPKANKFTFHLETSILMF